MRTAESYATLLGNADSEYLRERAVDIRDVSTQIMDAAYGTTPGTETEQLTAEVIVVADNLTPSQFMGLDKRYLRGLALAHAGATSHTVILARSLGIPCVTGIIDAARRVTPGATVVLDALRGILIPAPTEKVLQFYRAEIATGCADRTASPALRAPSGTGRRRAAGWRLQRMHRLWRKRRRRSATGPKGSGCSGPRCSSWTAPHLLMRRNSMQCTRQRCVPQGTVPSSFARWISAATRAWNISGCRKRRIRSSGSAPCVSIPRSGR